MNVTDADIQLFRDLTTVERNFWGSDYRPRVDEAMRLYEEGKTDECRKILDTFPSDKQLLDELLTKLKGKSVYKNLRRVADGKAETHMECLKAMSSLFTHICIEIDAGHGEYQSLLEDVYEKIGRALYERRVLS